MKQLTLDDDVMEILLERAEREYALNNEKDEFKKIKASIQTFSQRPIPIVGQFCNWLDAHHLVCCKMGEDAFIKIAVYAEFPTFLQFDFDTYNRIWHFEGQQYDEKEGFGLNQLIQLVEARLKILGVSL